MKFEFVSTLRLKYFVLPFCEEFCWAKYWCDEWCPFQLFFTVWSYIMLLHHNPRLGEGWVSTNNLPREILYVPVTWQEPVTFKVVVAVYCHSICHICYLFKSKMVFFIFNCFTICHPGHFMAHMKLVWFIVEGFKVIVIGRNTLTYVLLK